MPEGKKIKLPGVGEVKKSTALIGGGVVVAIVVFVYIRNKRAAAAASGNTTGTVTDPAGNVCAALNPQSGYCPGSPEDQQYLQQQSAGTGGYGPGYGGGAGYGTFVTDAQGNTCTALDPATGLCPVGSGSTGRTSVTTNAQWVQEAELQLGYNSTVQAALGYALSGQPVTQDQKNLFMEAIGLLGAPPQGYPPLNVVGGTHHPPPKAQVTVPDVTGESIEAASDILGAAGLKPGIPAHLRHGTTYTVSSTSPGPGRKVTTGSTVHLSLKITPGPKRQAPAPILPGR